MNSWLSEILNVAVPLLSAVVGGLIVALSNWWREYYRWRDERREKLAALKREAISRALEWIDPMRNAVNKASSLIMAAISGDIDDEEFLKEFPYLIGDLAKMDLPGNLRAVLPENAYSLGIQIVRDIERLRPLGVKYSQEARLKSKPMVGFKECSAQLDVIEERISTLEKELRKAFHETFN